MKTRPLQYESLKAVLLYLDANVRFQISHRLPAIRITEKVVPLRVRQFEFHSYETTINKTTYKLGVCQRWTPGKRVPADVKFWNSIGGVGHDLDKYGLKHDPGNTVLYEGDVSFCGKYPEYPWDMEERELELREQLRKLEHRMAPKLRSNISGRKRDDIEELASQIDDIRISLIPFNCRRDNRRSPYVCYLQLTILSGERRIKKIQRYGYTKKLHEAMKDLNNMLFGGRRAPIQIPEYLPPCSLPIIRLPVGFKMKTKYVTMGYVEFLRLKYDPVMSMLDDSCFPLNAVFVTDHINVEYHGRFPEIDNARKLVISNYEDEDLLAIVKDIPNQKILLAFSKSYEANEYFELVQSWLENYKPIGTCYSFVVQKEKTTRELLELASERIESTERKERCVVIPMRNCSVLEVSYTSIDDSCNMENRKYVNFKRWKWVLHIQVIGVE